MTLGVTGNAQLLLGTTMASINWRQMEIWYECIGVEPAGAALRIRHKVSGNTYRIAVEQRDGEEWAPAPASSAQGPSA